MKNCVLFAPNLTTRDHEVVSLNETSKIDMILIVQKRDICTQHQDKMIELFCQDHEEPCCSMCVSTTHRKCLCVETIDETAKKLRNKIEGKECELLLKDVEGLKHKLSDAKVEQEKFVTLFEKASEIMLEETERIFDEAVNYLQYLKRQHLTNMDIVIKKSKEKYEKNINTLEDGIQCAEYCAKSIGYSTGEENAAEMALTYYRGKKCFDNTLSHRCIW